MKKITIMKKQEVTDEEIGKYMNFDRLITSYDEMQSKTKIKLPKAAAVVVLIVAISASAVYFSLEKDVQLQQPEEIKLPNVINEHANTIEKKKPSKKAVEIKSAQKPTPSVKTKKATSKGTLTLAQEYISAEPELGYPHLYSYFEEQLRYPKEALKDSLQGIITASFVLNAKGEPEQIEILNSLGKPFDEEVNRLINDMPVWKPARLNGKAVASKISLPFTFSIIKKSN